MFVKNKMHLKLLLVCTSTVRNCLECRHRQAPKTPTSASTPSERSRSGSMRGQSQVVNGVDPIQALIMASHPTEKVSEQILYMFD